MIQAARLKGHCLLNRDYLKLEVKGSQQCNRIKTYLQISQYRNDENNEPKKKIE